MNWFLLGMLVTCFVCGFVLGFIVGCRAVAHAIVNGKFPSVVLKSSRGEEAKG